MDEQFVLHTPLMWIDKAETWALADELGVLDLIRHETLTCLQRHSRRRLRTLPRMQAPQRGAGEVSGGKMTNVLYHKGNRTDYKPIVI